MEVLRFLLAHRRWDPTCLRTNIATPEQIRICKRTKRVYLESNCLRRDAVDRLIARCLEDIAPESGMTVILNRNVTCQRHIDGNEGHSWILWLGDFEGGALVFDDGRRITERGVWHKIDGRVAHWNEPLVSGTKYGVVLFRRVGPTKRELIAQRS
jgi:hypothetical protein